MRASVVIATKDRKDDLRRAISSAVRQTEPVEILVLDDGSTDGTSEMVSSEFPNVRLERTPVSFGYVVQRNRGALLCSGEFVFSIDDDAEFSTAYVVERTLEEFSHPRVAAIAIPYVEPHKSSTVEFQRAPNTDAIWITESFRGTSHALRRKIFLRFGGYRERIIHQGEEMDLCIRLLNNGFVVRLGSGDVVVHNEAPQRDRRRIDFYGRRNDILFASRNVPLLSLPAHLLGTTFNGLRFALRSRSLDMIQGTLSGYLESCLDWRGRRPVSRNAYRIHRLLKKHGPKKLSDIERFLPSPGLPD